jgi:hypothetical protein
MHTEFTNHQDNGSFVKMDHSQKPRHRNLVKLIWVYKTKRDGTKKSRLCVQGCTQIPGVDFDQTYSGAMRSSSLRLLASIAARQGRRVRRFDFVAAYLQGHLEEGEVVYCRPPPGYETYDKDGVPHVYKVVKPVYGMAQAGRRWQRSLFPWLKEFGFVQSKSDPCVFVCRREVNTPSGPRQDEIHLGVYVDDLAISYKHDDSQSLYTDFINQLTSAWNVEDEGELTDLLGVEFTFSPGKVKLHQPRYIEKMVKEFVDGHVPGSAQANKRPYHKDLPQQVADALTTDVNEIDPAFVKKYQSIVGALLYCATNTRPDIAYAVSMLCRAMARPTPELYDAALQVLYYLYRTRDLGLTYETDDREMYGMSDSDWAVKHSTSGQVFVFNQAAISWGSKKQKSVALSSCEAEIVAASEAATEAVHLERFIREFDLKDTEPIELFVDNKSAIDVAYNPEHHTRMKHVERRHFFVRELVEEHKIRVPFVSTVDNLADFFTKVIEGPQFFSLRDRVMNIPPAASRASDPSPGLESRGGVE